MKPLPFKGFYVADDWGMSQEINEAILFLCAHGLVGRVSAIARAPFSAYLLSSLQSQNVDITMHFNLSWGANMAGRPLCFKDVLLSKIPAKEIKAELDLQWEFFKSKDIFLKGIESHQYVHCIPNVAKILKEFCAERNLKLIRKHEDWNHPLATMSSALMFKTYYNWKSGFRPLITKSLKMVSVSDVDMVIHPAIAVSKDINDSWRVKRFEEFKKITDFWQI